MRAPPERVYWAFLGADAMDASVGGTFRMSFTNVTTQQSRAFGGEYLEPVPGGAAGGVAHTRHTRLARRAHASRPAAIDCTAAQVAEAKRRIEKLTPVEKLR